MLKVNDLDKQSLDLTVTGKKVTGKNVMEKKSWEKSHRKKNHGKKVIVVGKKKNHRKTSDVYEKFLLFPVFSKDLYCRNTNQLITTEPCRSPLTLDKRLLKTLCEKEKGR